MSKLSATILLGTSLFAATSSEVETFLKNNIANNPMISDLEVKVIDQTSMDGYKGWEAFVVSLKAKLNQGGKKQDVKQRLVYFANGNVVANDLTDIKTGRSLRDAVAPKFKNEYYHKANLIYGSEKAKHKIAIFSDPLCPFCRRFVPGAIEYMKQYPTTFAVYYYHFPLERLHPAAVALTKAAIAVELQGRKDAVLEMYKVQVDARETDEAKILEAFNKAFNSNVTVKDIHSPMVEAHVKNDEAVIEAMMISGTPTIFFDGEKDGSKNRFKQVKVK